MNAMQMAQAAYGPAAQPTRTPRGVEYEAFARVTSRLKAVSGNAPARFRELAAAIHDNRRLWTLLAADAADDENMLPKELRARILYLAEFTRLHSGKVLRSAASAEVLVEINMTIMRGLHDRRRAS